MKRSPVSLWLSAVLILYSCALLASKKSPCPKSLSSLENEAIRVMFMRNIPGIGTFEPKPTDVARMSKIIRHSRMSPAALAKHYRTFDSPSVALAAFEYGIFDSTVIKEIQATIKYTSPFGQLGGEKWTSVSEAVRIARLQKVLGITTQEFKARCDQLIAASDPEDPIGELIEKLEAEAGLEPIPNLP